MLMTDVVLNGKWVVVGAWQDFIFTCLLVDQKNKEISPRNHKQHVSKFWHPDYLEKTSKYLQMTAPVINSLNNYLHQLN